MLGKRFIAKMHGIDNIIRRFGGEGRGRVAVCPR